MSRDKAIRASNLKSMEDRRTFDVISTSPEFQDSLTRLDRHEGYYSFDPRDPGGETKYGISKAAYPHLDIANLSKEQAHDIYLRDYWIKCQCYDMPPGIDHMVFDTAVNAGASRSILWMQLSIDASPDGLVGPETKRKLRQALELDAERFIIQFNSYRLKHYMDLDELNDVFGRGWAVRLLEVTIETIDRYRESLV